MEKINLENSGINISSIVYDNNPYLLIILTQKNELNERKKVKYVNKVAKKIHRIHRLIKNISKED